MILGFLQELKKLIYSIFRDKIDRGTDLFEWWGNATIFQITEKISDKAMIKHILTNCIPRDILQPARIPQILKMSMNYFKIFLWRQFEGRFDLKRCRDALVDFSAVESESQSDLWNRFEGCIRSLVRAREYARGSGHSTAAIPKIP